ncbi:MAG TPA: V-type ATP synthase subunit E [Candidatus Eisenbergiella merdavium]|uniref:V-type ATP synthase subunit E n=1 Tax=Candidatus Eisenbergiella merdavium TaxID=2838551 RepID=A0A9D2SPL0_9FIRM|nr:V-type ATP synthase subunit E [Candidatus Eisenbergiella merdavium]
MTTEEKLKHFMDVTTQKVNEENAEALEEYENGLDRVFADYKENAERKAELSLKLKEESLTKKKNAEVARRQMEIREETGRLQKELTEKLFSEVRGKLERFMGTGEYERFLIAQVRAAREFAGDDEIQIYIDPADIDKKNSIAAAANTTVMVSEYSFGGGIRAVIRSRGILIDQSFDTKIKEAAEGFVFHL